MSGNPTPTAGYEYSSIPQSNEGAYLPYQNTTSRNFGNVQPVSKIGMPCCKIGCCRRTCEESCCCECMGGCGVVDPRGSSRVYLFRIALFLSTLALLLQVIIALGTVKTNSMVQYFPWGTADLAVSDEGVTVDLYIGANRYVADMDGSTSAIASVTGGSFDDGATTYGVNWDDDEACSRQFNGSTYCDDCKDAVSGQVVSAYTGFLSSLGQVMADMTRMKYATDYNCQKVFGILTGIIGIASNFAAISLFETACVDAINDNFPYLSSNVGLGLGMQCLVASTAIKVFDTVVHALVPSPSERRSSGSTKKH